MAKVIQVIETTERRGLGRDESDPLRIIMQFYAFDGTLIVEHDPFDFGMYERANLRTALASAADYLEAGFKNGLDPEAFGKALEVIGAALSPTRSEGR